jgi:hypothetical protein
MASPEKGRPIAEMDKESKGKEWSLPPVKGFDAADLV